MNLQVFGLGISHGSNKFLPVISDVAFDVYFRIAGHPTIAL